MKDFTKTYTEQEVREKLSLFLEGTYRGRNSDMRWAIYQAYIFGLEHGVGAANNHPYEDGQYCDADDLKIPFE